MFRRGSFRIVAAAAACFLTGALASAAPADAATHTCISNWCSGSDTTTTDNEQGNSPQVYFGEVGYYYHDLGGGSPSCSGDPGGSCFNTTAAADANSRWQAGTGMGVQFYYLGGGADSSLEGGYSSPYCFGWAQAVDAENHINDYFSEYAYYEALYVNLDIEQNDTFGWSDTAQTSNRQVFNGFWDNIAGKSSAQNCSGSTTGGYQPAVYSSPGQWSYSFGSGSNATITNTPEWTSENCCTSKWPGSFNNAAWFGGSHYDYAWQFDEGPDYDVMYEPQYLPNLGITIGS